MGTVNATGSPTFTNLMSYGTASLAGITAGSTQTDTFNGTSLSALTTVGVIGQSSSANILSLTVGGSGKLLLTGSNTYTGNTTLNAGTLTAGAAENANVSGPFGKQPASAAVSLCPSRGCRDSPLGKFALVKEAKGRSLGSVAKLQG